MANWSLGVTESGTRSPPEERVMMDIEKSLNDAKKPTEENTMELKNLKKKKGISDKVKKAKFNARGKINKKESKEREGRG